MCKPTTEDEGEEQNNGGRDDNDYVHGADESSGSGGDSERADEHAQGGRSNSAGPSHSHHTQDDEHAQGGRTTNHNCGRIRLGLSGRGRENSGRGRGVQVVGRGSVQVTNGGSLHIAGGGPGAPVRGRLDLAGRKRPHPGTIQWQPGHPLDAGRGRGRGVTSHMCRGRGRLGVDGLGRGRGRPIFDLNLDASEDVEDGEVTGGNNNDGHGAGGGEEHDPEDAEAHDSE